MHEAWATFDPSKAYRFTLGRAWDPSKPRAAFIMLNPSTATEKVLDPTVRRCRAFAKAWGYGSVEVGNLFALRSTDPKALYTHPDPIGPGNDEALMGIQDRAAVVIAAWGIHGRHLGRGFAVKTLLAPRGPLKCLAVTKDGQPGHPLYIRAAAPLLPVPGVL